MSQTDIQADSKVDANEETGSNGSPRVSPQDPAGAAVRASIAACAEDLRAHGAAALSGDPTGIHQMRTAARRLRGQLRAFRPLVDEAWADRLSGELRWLGGVLGDVRDLDVLQGRLLESGGDLVGSLGTLFSALEAEGVSARAALQEALRGERYRNLLALLDESAHFPALTESAEEPCRAAVPPLVDAVWKRLRRGGRALRPDSPDDDFHAIRKRAKGVRHAADAAARVLPGRAAEAAEGFSRRARRIQDVLGQHQDAVVAIEAIERIAASHPSDAPFQRAAGRLIERQSRAARAALDDFPKAWARLDRKKWRRWMRP